MTAMWFGLAAIALVGAIVLLYFDRVQRQRSGHARQVWAKAQGYTYVSLEPALPATWRRGALAKLGYLSAVDVVSGIRKGEKFVLFDLEDAATLVAVRRQIGSDIDVDMRLKTASPPKDADLELLGAIGDRVVFATNPEIARHAVDQRMVAFIESLPDTVQMLWSEGNWTLGMLSVGTVSKEWEAAIDAVLRLSGLLHVLPPVTDSPSAESDRPQQRPAEARSDDDESADDELPGGGSDRRYPGRPYDQPVETVDSAPRSEPRRPSLAVVPDARQRTHADRRAPGADQDRRVADQEPREDAPRDDEVTASTAGEDPARAGGPFHPGFRPYQGPVPK